MAKLIALAAGDIHFHDWKQFNENDERIQISINFLVELFLRSHEEHIPILFVGDMFHTPKGLTTKTIYLFNQMMQTVSDEFYSSRMYGITGNHEKDKEYSSFKAMSFAFPKIIYCIDDKAVKLNHCSLVGIPYSKRNVGVVDKIKEAAKVSGDKILLLHTELYGAPDPSGYELEPQNLPRNLNALFKDFNLVLAGHVHKFTQVEKNIYMVGAPNQQRKSDSGCKMGYLEIYDDFSVKFIECNISQFRYYKEGEEHENTNDFWIEIPKPKKLKKQSEAEFRPTMDKTTMAKRYARETGVKSLKKINALINILNETDE